MKSYNLVLPFPHSSCHVSHSFFFLNHKHLIQLGLFSKSILNQFNCYTMFLSHPGKFLSIEIYLSGYYDIALVQINEDVFYRLTYSNAWALVGGNT